MLLNLCIINTLKNLHGKRKSNMISMNMSNTTHKWKRMNLFAIVRNGRQFDEYKCELCGIKGLSGRLGYVEFQGNIKDPYNCKKAPVPLTIKIIRCNATGEQFRNLTPGSIHQVICPPPGKYGLWVMGAGEPVKVLPSEYVSVKLSPEQEEQMKKDWYDDVL